MQFKFGPLVSDAAGSIGGTTFQRSFIAPVARTKPSPTRRRTTYTARNRSWMQFLSKEWRNLSTTKKDAWQVEADNLTWLNKFGDTIRGLGYWLYVRCNQYNALQSTAYIDTPGTIAPLDAITDPSGDFSAVSTWPVSWTAPGSVSSGQRWLLFASRWQSAGRSATFGTLRLVAIIPTSTSPPYDAYGDYVARFGAAPPAGCHVFARLLPLDAAAGYQGVPVEWIAET